MPDKIYSLTIAPGIQRDGTPFTSNSWIDGQWCRFYRGLPLKMGGYSQIDASDNIARGTYVVPNSPNFNVYIGDYESLTYFPIDGNGNRLGVSIDRTPQQFNANNYNLWSFDTMYSTTSNSGILIAHAPPNLFSIDNDVETPVYYGDLYSTAPLVETGISVSGGIVVLHPFLFVFGDDGYVSWTNANDPTTLMDSTRASGRKIIAGFPTRGGNSSPAGLLWSLDSVIRVTQVGTTDVEFSFDTVTSDSSILSSKCIVEYDGIYYWAGVDRFLFYNGVVQELPNQMNLNYFFSNLNYSQRQKVWATKITKWGEIIWFYPSGNSTECDSAILYNIREQSWYDTKIARSSGYFEQTFAKPIWTDSAPNSVTNNYDIWTHEIGVDKNYQGNLTAIDSYFESSNIAWVGSDPNRQSQEVDRYVDLYRLEPDFLQSGQMSLIVNGKEYANSPVQSSSPYFFDENTLKIDIREQRREMTLRFESDEVGGNYQMGRVLMVMRLGDTRA